MSKQTYMLHVWNNGQGELLFSEIKNSSFRWCKEWFDYHLMVNGKAATVYCFFSDYDIRDEELIAIATKFMKGEYTNIEVDLYWGTVQETKGIDKTNPPY